MPQTKSSSRTESVELFQDEKFPTSEIVLDDGSIVNIWKRPHELSKQPRLFVDNATRSDVVQGALRDCWFISACAAVAQNPDLLSQIIPKDNTPLYGEGYNGKVTFFFWRLGHWEKVEIDDRLPVDETDNLVYSRCTHVDEFWVPLIEKAFAKFNGGYDNLVGGDRSEGLISLSGYVVEDEKTGDADLEQEGGIFNVVKREVLRKSLITCSYNGPYRKGLAGDHTYTVTGAHRVLRRRGDEVRLVRVRNPWGASFDSEWTGAWRDNDSRWDDIEKSAKDRIQYKIQDDGEFWMEEKDFIENFEAISIAMKMPFFDTSPLNTVKYFQVLQGSWKEGINAGGSQISMEKFSTNPQFLLIVRSADTEEDDCFKVVLELIQDTNRLTCRSLEGIALSIYEVNKPRARLSERDLYSTPELYNHEHRVKSAVVYNMFLQPGAYVLLASTYKSGCNRDFILRSYSQHPIELRSL